MKLDVDFQDRGFFHYRRAAFSAQLKNKVGLALAKAAALRITLNLDGTPIYLHHTLTHHTRKLLVYLPRLYLQVFQFLEQPSVSEACKFIIFRFQSFIAPTIIYRSCLQLSLYRFNNKQALRLRNTDTTNPVYERRVNLLVLVCSLSSHRHIIYRFFLYLSHY